MGRRRSSFPAAIPAEIVRIQTTLWIANLRSQWETITSSDPSPGCEIRRSREAFKQPSIKSALFDQFVMSPSFYDPTVIEDQDQIRIPNRAQSMSHDKTGPSLEQNGERCLQTELRLHVDAAGRFIQDQ